MDPTHTPTVTPTPPPAPAVIPSAPTAPELPKQPEHLLPPVQKGSWGAFVGIVIIVIVLVIGALYFWGVQLEKQENLQSAGTEGTPATEQ